MRYAAARSTALWLVLVTLLLGAGCPRAGAKASTAWPSKVHGSAVGDAGEEQEKVAEQQKGATRQHAGAGDGTSGASEGSPRVRLGVPGRLPAAACENSNGVA